MLVAHMQKGFSFITFAAVIDVNPDTLHEWVKRHKEFSDTKRFAFVKCQLQWEQVGLAGMNGKISGFQTGMWIFNMKNRFRWKDQPDPPQDELPDGFAFVEANDEN